MTRLVAMLCYEDAQMLDIAGPLEVFARTSRWLQDHRGLPSPPYRVIAVARKPGMLELSNGLQLRVSALTEVRAPDTFLITGGIGVKRAINDPHVVDWVRKTSQRARRVAGVCTGSILLAAAGLLKGHRATTHWAYLKDLQQAE